MARRINRPAIPRAVTADPAARALLPGAQFADAFYVILDGDTRDARALAETALGQSPGWVDGLMALRNTMVAPFGLKAAAPGQPGAIGIFPVISETPERLVVGFDDKHLDFRAVIDVAGAGHDRRVTATTVVRMHNPLGRLYLTTIMPFHWLVVGSMLRRLAAR